MQYKQLKIKVCGMREPDNITAVAALHPAYMGFLFYEKSPRYVSRLNKQTIKQLQPEVTPVAVFLNASLERILTVCDKYGFDTVQLHGSESPEMCKMLMDNGISVLKAVAITSQADIDALQQYVGAVSMFVFDTKTADGTNGGSGCKWNWSLLKGYDLPVPFLLSGGIGADDAEAVIAASAHPAMVGVDINSRFETAPAHKDINLITKFIKTLQQ